MIILTIIYSLIILYIIVKGLYISRKPIGNIQNRESLQDSISLSALPFYINQGKIDLFAFAINFFFLSLISFILIPEFIQNHSAFCSDYDYSNEEINNDFSLERTKTLRFSTFYTIEENIYEKDWYIQNNKRSLPSENLYIYNQNIFKKELDETYRISNLKYPFIFYLNLKHIQIYDYLKVFKGFSLDLNTFLNQQKSLLKTISSSNYPELLNVDYLLDENNIYKNINTKSNDLLSLIANAYKQITILYNKSDLLIHYPNNFFSIIFNNRTDNLGEVNQLIRDFIGDHQINNLNFKITEIFNSLEIIQKITKENSNVLDQLKIINLKTYKIKTFENLNQECNKILLSTFENRYTMNAYSIHQNINCFYTKLENDFFQRQIFAYNGFLIKDVNIFYYPFFEFNNEELESNFLNINNNPFSSKIFKEILILKEKTINNIN